MFFQRETAHTAVRKLVLTAMFAACYVVLARLVSFQTETLKLSTAFLAVALAAYTVGPVAAALTIGLGDLISAMLFMPGAYLPQLTLTLMVGAAVEGILLGGRLHTDKLPLLLRVILAVLFTEWVCEFLINSFWLWLLFSKGRTYLIFLAPRALQSLVTTAVQIFAIYALGALTRRTRVRV